MEIDAGDERLAIDWLKGRDRAHVELVYTPDGKKTEQLISVARGHAALIRLLRGNVPMGATLRGALASALEARGSSEMRLNIAHRRGPGRPRKNSVADALEAVKLTTSFDQKKKAGALPKNVIAELGASRSKATASMAKVRKARAIIQFKPLKDGRN